MNDDNRFLKQRVEELEELNRLAESLAKSSNVDELLAAIVLSGQKLCHAEHAAILLYSPLSREVVQTLVRSADTARGGIDHGLNLVVAGWIEHHGKPLITPDIADHLNLKKPVERWRDIGPALAVPLITGGKNVGILNLVNHVGSPEFTQDSLRLAEAVAAFAAQFIARTRLQESLFQDNQRLKAALSEKRGAREILGESPAIRNLRQKIATVAPTGATVVLIGETGTGKELAARAIHFQSQRAEKPFVGINCSAIPATLFESELFGHERGAFTGASGLQKGKFELASEGTLFLDEITEMPMDLQPKLLRVLEERSFYRLGSSILLDTDMRVIAASSRDLHSAVGEGRFREELLHRLSVVTIYLPPLRERHEDIAFLATEFLQEFSRGTKRFTPEALATLQKLPWKGNVRELRNTIERLCIFLHSDQITASDLAEQAIGTNDPAVPHLTAALQTLIRTNPPGNDILKSLEEEVVRLSLLEVNGNVSRAAKLLGIERKAFQRRIEKHGIPR
jgi:transcriptional regulator with GAF, ATPase, and Fis domain